VLHEVEEINPDLMLLSNGRLLAHGSPQEIRDVLSNQQELVDGNIPEIARPGFEDKVRITELFIRCNDNYILAKRLFDSQQICSLAISKDKTELTVGTTSVREVYTLLPEIAVKENLEFYEFRSADGSLDDLFSSLMKIHRGES
jgi:ABC-2 type transport system ATP-binding protein